MKPALKYAFEEEMSRAREHYGTSAWPEAFAHLERAHVLGQQFFWPHLRTHGWMFRVGLRRRDLRESVGQLGRGIAVVPAYVFAWVPVGNTGGSDVSALRPMPIPQDLAALLPDPRLAQGRGRRWAGVLVAIGLISAAVALGWS